MTPERPTDLDELLRRPDPGPHRTRIVASGREVETLADLPPLRNRLLFVGLQPSSASIAAGHYHQGGAGRAFWDRLITATILPAETDHATADDALLAAGHGITDLVKAPPDGAAANDAELTAGVGPLWQKIALWRPAAIVFVEHRAASIAAGRDVHERWGQLAGVALAGRPCFVMPASDAPSAEVDEGLNLLRNLAAALPRE